MGTSLQTLSLETALYRRLLLVSAIITSLHVVIAGGVTLHLIAGILVAICGTLALFQSDQDALVRRPPLLAMSLLILHVLLSFAAAMFELPLVGVIASAGITPLIVAALVVPAVALTFPDQRISQRVGGRARKQWQRYLTLIVSATAGVWLLLVTSGVARIGFEWAQGVYLGLLLTISLLTLLLLAQTWRTRRSDRPLLYTAEGTAGLALAQAAAVGTALGLSVPSLPATITLLLNLALWLGLVTLLVLGLRRPIPAVAEHSATAAAAALDQPKTPSLLADYISLTKPKVISLLLVTTLGGMLITDAGLPSLWLVFWTLLGGYLAAGGAGAINCAFDEKIDINMGRTSRRPVPSGRISARNAFLFGGALSILSVVVLYVFTTPLAAALATLGIFYYAFFYTRLLKRQTWQNIVIGGGAGSLPPLVGWAAVTGSLTLPAVVLFLIIFYWTPPHFWALALVKEKDYARAGVPMLPVLAGEAETRWQIWLYSLLMFALTLLPVPLQAMGALYLVLAVVLGVIFLRSAWQVWQVGGQVHIWGLYKYSLLYLALLFAAMVADRLILG